LLLLVFVHPQISPAACVLSCIFLLFTDTRNTPRTTALAAAQQKTRRGNPAGLLAQFR
jgi:hypothetical protein